MKIYKILSLFIIQVSLFTLGIYCSQYLSWQDLVFSITKVFHKKQLKTYYGIINIDEPIIQDALHNQALLRMKKIDQGGPSAYFHYAPHFSRYDHCVGVFSLIKKYGGSQSEQLTGLFHDISHTAFSHVADLLFIKDGTTAKHSYQDQIHIEFLKNSPISTYCEKYNIPIESLDPDNGTYNMLENDLPDICADRLEYNLRTGVVYKLLDEKDISMILDHLHYQEVSFYNDQGNLQKKKMWFFDDILYAKKFAMLPLHFIKTVWNSPWSMVLYKVFSELLIYSFEKKYLTQEDFLYGTDQDILDKLYKINDNYVIYTLHIMHNINDIYSVVDNPEKDGYDDILQGKFRGINPLVLIKDSLYAVRLTELDYDFYTTYNMMKEECKKNIYIKYKKPYKAKEII